MHLITTGAMVLAAYASGAAAGPQYHQPYRRQGLVSNDTTSSVSSPEAPTSVSLPTSSMIPVLSSLSSSSVLPSAPSTTSSAAASTSTTAQTIAVQGGTYTSVGCFIDTANTGYPLVNAVKVATSSTTQQCLATCAEASVGGPYGYFGVEGTECFCSNQFTSGAPQSPGSCGAMKRNIFGKRQTGNAITIYAFTPDASSSSSVMSSTSLTVSTSQPASSSIVSLSIITASFATPSTSLSSTATTDSTTTSATSATLSSTSATLSSTSATLSSTSSSQASTTSPSAPVVTPGGAYYIVASGDTLSSLAQRYGISLAALEAINPQIADPNFISPGEYINLPSANPATPSPNPSGTATYTVNSGDTLSSIAAAFGIPLSSLEAANPNITDPNFITPGQRINIPSVRVFTYSIKAGDTLSALANVFGIALAALEAANPQITNPNLIFPGQVINVP